MSSSFRPTRPGRCMSPTAVARSSATRSRHCSSKAGFAVHRASTTSTTPAPRSTSWRARPYLRYREALGEAVGPIPEGYYPGDYLIETGRALAERDGRKWLGRPEAEWLAPVREFRRRANDGADSRRSWRCSASSFDVFVSERELVEQGTVGECLAALDERGLIYVGRAGAAQGQAARRLGAAGRRPCSAPPTSATTSTGRSKKSDGSWTYFAADIAYHRDKFRRGFRNLIDVWGADHGGYVKRMQAAVQAVTERCRHARRQALPARPVCSTRASPVRMSKRAGTFVTLREVVDEVGKDVFRFIMLTRRNDQTLGIRLCQGHRAVKG